MYHVIIYIIHYINRTYIAYIIVEIICGTQSYTRLPQTMQQAVKSSTIPRAV